MRRSPLAWPAFCIAAAIAALTVAVPGKAHPEIDEALTRLNAQIAASPADAELYLERGALYARHQEWVFAEANYLRAAEISPGHPRLDGARGAVELATGRPAEALAHFDAALARAPREAEMLVLRARAHAALGNAAAAEADYRAALALIASPSPELLIERARLLAPADAIRSLDEGLERIGPALTLHLFALALEESQGWTDAAVARVNRIAEQSERKETWFKRRGDLLGRAGRVREARAAYIAALAALATLPPWLRESPDAVRLQTELNQLTASRS